MQHHKEIPIPTIDLIPVLDHLLIELLRSLSKEDWERRTIARKWNIKDIVAHMLDTNIRTISLSRDKYQAASSNSKPYNYQQLVQYLNELNASWVSAFKRVSPQVLIELLDGSNKVYHQHISTWDPFAPAIFPVAWAGESSSVTWFHIAREYTEKYIHQQQIRDALGRDELYAAELFRPFIETFMQALPFTYRNTLALDGTKVTVQVASHGGGCWTIVKKKAGWVFTTPSPKADNLLDMRPDTAWKLFSKGITPKEALPDIDIRGNKELCLVALDMIAVMA